MLIILYIQLFGKQKKLNLTKLWTKEEIKFIKDNIDSMSLEEIAKKLNKTLGAVIYIKEKYHICSKATKVSRKLEEGVRELLPKCTSIRELTVKLRRKYRYNISENAVRRLINVLKLDKPINYRRQKHNTGDIIIYSNRPYVLLNKELYEFYKRKGASRRGVRGYDIPLTHKVWIDAHGVIANDCVIIQIDTNTMNTDLSNLRMVTRTISMAYSKYLKDHKPLLPKLFDIMCKIWTINSKCNKIEQRKKKRK